MVSHTGLSAHRLKMANIMMLALLLASMPQRHPPGQRFVVAMATISVVLSLVSLILFIVSMVVAS